jgi:hypothetical protein
MYCCTGVESLGATPKSLPVEFGSCDPLTLELSREIESLTWLGTLVELAAVG